MVVDQGIADFDERQTAQPVDRLVGIERAAAHVVDQLAQRCFVHPPIVAAIRPRYRVRREMSGREFAECGRRRAANRCGAGHVVEHAELAERVAGPQHPDEIGRVAEVTDQHVEGAVEDEEHVVAVLALPDDRLADVDTFTLCRVGELAQPCGGRKAQRGNCAEQRADRLRRVADRRRILHV